MSRAVRITAFFRLAPIVVAGLVAGCNSPSTTSDATSQSPAAPVPGATTAAQPAGGGGRIVIVTNATSPFWVAVEKGMNDAAKQSGVNVELVRNNEGTAAGQIQRLDQVSAQSDVKGVALSVIDSKSEAILSKMRALLKKGVKVVTLDSDGAKDARLAYIGADNIKAGMQAGHAAAQLLPGGGKVVTFVGTQSAANARERLEGFKKGAGPKFTVVDVMEDGTDTNKAHENVTAAIQAHPDARVLLGLWSYNAPAIADEVKKAGKRSSFKVVTFDAEPNTLQALSDRIIDATVVQQPYEYGFQAVKLLNAMIKNDTTTVKTMVPASTIIDVPCRTVASDPAGPVKGPNVIPLAEIQKYLQQKGLKGT